MLIILYNICIFYFIPSSPTYKLTLGIITQFELAVCSLIIFTQMSRARRRDYRHAYPLIDAQCLAFDVICDFELIQQSIRLLSVKFSFVFPVAFQSSNE